jgi:hypothetical protein
VCTLNILYDLKAAYRSISNKDCIQEQQQEILAQVSMVVFNTGLLGRPPITQFTALPTEQDTGCCARRTAQRKIRLSSRDTLLRLEDMKSYLPRGTDMRQTRYLIYGGGGTRHFRTFVRCHAFRSRPQFVGLRTIYDRTVGGTNDVHLT